MSSGTISMYLSEISQYEPLSPDKEVELAVLIDKGDKRAMKELVILCFFNLWIPERNGEKLMILHSWIYI